MKPKASPEYRSNSAPISLEGATLMIASTRNYVAYAWNFLFNHEVSPLRNIPDVGIRHYVLQVLGFMWAVSFSTRSEAIQFLLLA